MAPRREVRRRVTGGARDWAIYLGICFGISLLGDILVHLVKIS